MRRSFFDSTLNDGFSYISGCCHCYHHCETIDEFMLPSAHAHKYTENLVEYFKQFFWKIRQVKQHNDVLMKSKTNFNQQFKIALQFVRF